MAAIGKKLQNNRLHNCMITFFMILYGVCFFNNGLNGSDFSRYASKDVQSFVQGIEKDTKLSIVLSAAPTRLAKKEVIILHYSEYCSDFGSDLLIERLIPLDIRNESNNSILLSVYIPHMLLLKKRDIDTFFQPTEKGILEPLVIAHKAKILLSDQMTKAMAQKVEMEHIQEIMMIRDNMIEAAKKSLGIIIEENQEKMKKLKESHKQKLISVTLKLEKTINEITADRNLLKGNMEQMQKNKVTDDFKNKELQEELTATKKSYDILKDQCKKATANFLDAEKSINRLTWQRNILLCAIPLVAAIVSWWHISKSIISND